MISISVLALCSLSVAAEPITLEAALAEAARANLDLALARNARDAADADVLGSYRGFLPRLDVSAAFGRDYVGSQRQVRVVPVVDTTTDPPTITYDQQPVWTPERDFADYTVGVRLEQRLFEGLRSVGQAQQARAARRAAELAIDETALAVAFDVTRRFYEVVKAEQSLAVLEETVRQSETLVERADALFAAGRIARGETYSARVNLGNDRINVEAESARLARARSELALVLGRGADPTLSVAAPPELARPASHLVSYEPPAPAELVSRALERRPARAREREQERAAELGVRVARADWYPAIGLGLSYSRQGQDLTGNTGVYGADLSRQYVGIAQVYVQWNLFDGLGTVAQSDRAEAQAERARLETEQTEHAISNEVVAARASLVALGRAALVSEANVAAAESSVRLATERFEAGAATQLEVRDAQLKLTQARLTLVSTRSDYAIALADLNRAVGGGL